MAMFSRDWRTRIVGVEGNRVLVDAGPLGVVYGERGGCTGLGANAADGCANCIASQYFWSGAFEALDKLREARDAQGA